MADTKLYAPIYPNRTCSPNVRYTYQTPVITDTGVIFTRIRASADQPVIVEAQVCVTTVDATETVSVGISDGGRELVNAASLGTAATGGTFLPASSAKLEDLFTSDTERCCKGSTGPDAGGVFVI